MRKKGVSFKHSGQFKKGQPPWNKGVPHSEETKKKISLIHKGNTHRRGTVLSEETKRKISENRKGKNTGANNPKWIVDKTKLARVSKQGERRSSACFYWRKQVWLRDNFKCKIANPDCSGRIEAHHILGWTEYPELRYQINNGITLCHAHHPRKRSEEKRLSPYFQALVSVSKE